MYVGSVESGSQQALPQSQLNWLNNASATISEALITNTLNYLTQQMNIANNDATQVVYSSSYGDFWRQYMTEPTRLFC